MKTAPSLLHNTADFPDRLNLSPSISSVNLYTSMPKAILLAVLSTLIGVNSAGAVTLQKYMANRDQPGYDIYFVGLSDGLYWANTAAGARGAPLFCAPDNLAIVPEQYENILMRYVSKSPVNSDQEEVGMILQFALQDAFPC